MPNSIIIVFVAVINFPYQYVIISPTREFAERLLQASAQDSSNKSLPAHE